MGKRKGSFLERVIAGIFESVGFYTSLNSKEFGFESDVIAKKDGFTVLIETKQYDRSYINIGSLLHQWASKGKTAGVDRTLVVITGQKIKEKHFKIAKGLGVYLWDEETVHRIQKSKNPVVDVGILLEFGGIIDRLRDIENSGLRGTVKHRLIDEAKNLSKLEFEKSLVEAKNKKVLYKVYKKRFEEKVRDFKNRLDKAKKRKRTFTITKITSVVVLLIAFFIFLESNHSQENINEIKPQLVEDLAIIPSPPSELEISCGKHFKSVEIHDITYKEEFKDYNAALEWLQNESSIGEEKVIDYRTIILEKAEYPLLVVKASRIYRVIPRVREKGVYFCDDNGLLN